MLDTKYGVKYSFPHSVVHIVDNSMYTGELPRVIAEDPSMYATIVVSGAPIGESNKMITLDDTKVSSVAFGLGNLDPSTIKKYGQSITYVDSLIRQGVPVRFMRVTPEDAEYGAAIIGVQWRIDIDSNIMHVRFKSLDWPTNLIRSKFQNTQRVNEALVNAINTNGTITEDGFTWKQRAFINVIGAGKGSAYNNMTFCVNTISQGKNPANVAYRFATIDDRTSLTVEQFDASLVNINNAARIDAIKPVNIAVSTRVTGSSILKPYVCETTIQEMFKDYMALLKNIVDSGLGTDFINRVIASTNVNTFDVVYGNYIYNGTDENFKLPAYQVDTPNSDIVHLGVDQRVDSAVMTVDQSVVDYGLDTFQNKVIGMATGITNIDDDVHIGDLYLTASGSSKQSNAISVIAAINQYTGSVSAITIPNVYPLIKTDTAYMINTEVASKPLNVILEELIDTADLGVMISKSTINEKYPDINDANIQEGDVIAAENGKTFEVYYVEKFNKSKNNINIMLVKYTDSQLYFALDRNSHKNLLKGTGNLMAWDYDNYSKSLSPYIPDNYNDAVLNMVGYGVIEANAENVNVYVNTYNRLASNNVAVNRVLINGVSKKYGPVPETVYSDESVVGTSYDVLSYDPANVASFVVKDINTPTAGTQKYAVGDLVSLVIDATTDTPKQITDDSKIYSVNPADQVLYQPLTEKPTEDVYTLLTESPDPWDATQYYKLVEGAYVQGTAGEEWAPDTWYSKSTVSTFDPTQYYKKQDNDRYVHGVAGEEWALDTWYEYDPQPAMYDKDGNLVFYAKYNPTPEEGQPKYSDKIETFSSNLAYTDQTTGTSYVYDATAKTLKPVSTVTYTNGDTPTVIPTDAHTIFKVTEVDENRNILTVVPVRRTPVPNTAAEGSPLPYSTIFGSTPKEYPLVKINEYAGGSITDYAKASIAETDVTVVASESPESIKRYNISGSLGSLYRITSDPIVIPANYYNPNEYGISLNSEDGGVDVTGGSTGFFDDEEMNSIEYKWRYSQLLVKAYKGYLDKTIKSPVRCPAMYLFDGAWNTIVGANMVPELTYTPEEIINASTIFTEDEKEAILFDKSIIDGIRSMLRGSNTNTADIDVKAAMYELMDFRVFDGIPEHMRPIGMGSGLQLMLDCGISDDVTTELVAKSFEKRFNTWNASWDIGGYVDATTGLPFTYMKRIVDNIFTHLQTYNVNKPFVNKYATIPANEFISFFPDIDTIDWDKRETAYKAGGNVWILDSNGNLSRQSQRTLYRVDDTSDMMQENNTRTLSQLVYLLRNKLNTYILEYSDDDTLKTMTDDCNTMFSNWVGTRVDGLNISFERDINPLDGGELVVCYCDVRFRGLILRVPTIVNIQRRNS